jgi:hypothetical protein
MAGSFDGTLGSDPEHQDRPHRWLGSSILHAGVRVLKPDWSFVSVVTEPSQERGYAFRHCLGSKAESAMRASYVNESNHLRERAIEMRASSKELKDNNTVAVIMRLADLYDRLADRAETRGNRAVLTDETKEGAPPTRS